MDIALHYADEYFFDPYVYPDNWPRDNYLRQFASLNLICDVGGALLYLITASLSWLLIFDDRLLKHKLALEVYAPPPTRPCSRVHRATIM